MSEATGPAEDVMLGFADEARERQAASEARWGATPDRHVVIDGERAQFARPKPPVIVIQADDGAELLRITREGGRLDVSGDESRWTEAAARFVAEMRRIIDAGA